MSKGKAKSARSDLNGSATHLLHRALQLALDFHAEAAGPASITQRQFTVLAAAGAAEGTTQNDLVRATGIDRSTLADLVARMITKGLLERERSATDARANTVRLSEAGRAALEVGAGAATAADERLLGLLPPKKREALMKCLAVLADTADAPAAGEPKKVKAEKPAKAAKAPKAPKVKKDKKHKVKKVQELGA